MTQNCSISHHPEPHDEHSHDRGYGRVRLALVIASALALVQGVGSYLSGSLALLADTVHVLSDTASLAVTLAAGILASRPQSQKRSFGYYRLEVLAALINGTALLIVSILILKESYGRWVEPTPLIPNLMLRFSIIGLVMNLVMLFALHPARKENLNIKGAYFHVLGDALSSVVVVASAAVIWMTDLYWVDAVAGAFVAIIIAGMAIRLLHQSTHILLEGTPMHLNAESIQMAIRFKFKEVVNIHDFHIWQITSDLVALSAHIEARIQSLEEQTKLLSEIDAYLEANYHIQHSTIQIETAKN